MGTRRLPFVGLLRWVVFALGLLLPLGNAVAFAGVPSGGSSAYARTLPQPPGGPVAEPSDEDDDDEEDEDEDEGEDEDTDRNDEDGDDEDGDAAQADGGASANVGAAGGSSPSPTPPTVADRAPLASAPSGLDLPVQGRITQRFSRSHLGIDIAAPQGTPIRASADGVVSAAGRVPVGGLRVCVGHGGGVETCYYHASAIHVRVGQTVARGERIAAVGSTGEASGPHVHWEVRRGGRLVDPLAR